MGLFSSPEKKLGNKLEAGWLSMRFAGSGSVDADRVYERIVNEIHQAAQPLVARGQKDVALARINGARRSDGEDQNVAIWHQMLDTVIEHL